jgi:hypothetical protein
MYAVGEGSGSLLTSVVEFWSDIIQSHARGQREQKSRSPHFYQLGEE